MSAPQNLTKTNEVKDMPIPFEMLQLRQQWWIDYTALGGLITNADGSLDKVTVSDFADQIGVSRETLYAWRKSIPNFWQLVGERNTKLFSESRTTKVINAWYLGATAKLNPQLIAMWMANQKMVEFRMPQQDVKVEAGNSWAALLQAKRQPEQDRKVIDAEVGDAPNSAN